MFLSVMRLVVPGNSPSPLWGGKLEPGSIKHHTAPDLVEGLVELLVEDVLDLSVSLRRNASLDVPGGQRLAELVTVIALAGNQGGATRLSTIFRQTPSSSPVAGPKQAHR